MAVKNKAKDRNDQGRIRRKYTGPWNVRGSSILSCLKFWVQFISVITPLPTNGCPKQARLSH